MKRIWFILLVFFVSISLVKAETIIDDYKVEIVVEENGVLDVKESFKVVSLDDNNKVFWKIRPSSTYGYETNLDSFVSDVYLKYVDYFNFKLEEGKEYYLDYKVYGSSPYTYYDFFQITEDYNNLESILYKRFYLMVRSNNNTTLDISDIYNYSNMVVSIDDNVLTGVIEAETRLLDSFEIRINNNNYVVNNNQNNNSDSFFIDVDNIGDKDLKTYYTLLVLLPGSVFGINLLIGFLVFIRKKSEIDDTSSNNIAVYDMFIKRPTKPIYRLMIGLVVTSYFLSLSSTAIISKHYLIMIGVAFLMGFYSLFYNAMFFQTVGTEAWIGSKVFLFIIRLIIIAFVIFHSAVFASVVLGIEPFSWSIVSKYFWIGFLINALNLEMISWLKR